ncbi:MAG: hypothetical protein ABW252_13070 [Polyangiales bacterium]
MMSLATGALAALSVAAFAFVACDAPSVSVPVKPGAVRDVDDEDEEAEEATLFVPCESSDDCPGDENDVCSPTRGCVECTTDAHCEAGETCVGWGDCENIARRP